MCLKQGFYEKFCTCRAKFKRSKEENSNVSITNGWRIFLEKGHKKRRWQRFLNPNIYICQSLFCKLQCILVKEGKNQSNFFKEIALNF